LAIHEKVGEEEAATWLEAAKKDKEKVAKQSKSSSTPKSASSSRTRSGAAAASASTLTEAGATTSELALAKAEVESMLETMRDQYCHLVEMDEAVREKLFILQVRLCI
jgi:hypothetical protein